MQFRLSTATKYFVICFILHINKIGIKVHRDYYIINEFDFIHMTQNCMKINNEINKHHHRIQASIIPADNLSSLIQINLSYKHSTIMLKDIYHFGL